MNTEIDYLDPKTDFIFKAVFGNEEHKDILISFLNALFDGNPVVRDIDFENPNIEKLLKDDKHMRLDVRATCDNGLLLDVEIQCQNTGEIPDRAFHYLANLFPHGIKENEAYDTPKAVGIWILGENVTSRKNAISEAYMTFQESSVDSYEIMTDKGRIFFIELKKFNPKNMNMKSILDAWLLFLKEPRFVLEEEQFLKIREVKEAMSVLEYVSTSDEMRALYDLRLRTQSARNSELTMARREGIEKGMEKGVKQGIKQGMKEGLNLGMRKGIEKGEKRARLDVAKHALSMGFSLEEASKLSGLTMNEIRNDT